MSTLYYGDNLNVLQEHLADESVDLIYLDPPFNSGRDYNAIFNDTDASGKKDQAQVHAFTDTWSWGEPAARAFDNMVKEGGLVADLLRAFRVVLGDKGSGGTQLAYLSMMAPRLMELRRVLKPTGSIYLHCDPTASHYLKMLMDAVFGMGNFRNEIVWKRTSAHNDPGRFGNVHDTVLFYGKSPDGTWCQIHQPYDESYLKSHYGQMDPNGRRFRLSDLTGPGTGNGPSSAPWRETDPTQIGRSWSVPRYLRASLGISDKAPPQEALDILDAAGRIIWPKKPGGMPAFKRYLDEMLGLPCQDTWTDIPPVNSQAAERLGYPTQKPRALLDRIIRASSNEGDVVLDPFCVTGDTRIVTSTGLRPISEIQIGDSVLTHEGRFRPVVKTYKNPHDGPLLTIRRAKSTVPLRVTPNHALLVVRAESCPYDNRRCLPRVCKHHRANKHKNCPHPSSRYVPEWVPSGEVRPGDFVYIFKEGFLYSVKSVESGSFTGEVFNLEVDEDHSYVTESFTAHNCGCGTCLDSAQALGRQWIGIDITHLAVGVIKKRLFDVHGIDAGKDYTVIGEPADLAGAEALAGEDRHQFQTWALGLVGARESSSPKGGDRGIDGVRLFGGKPPLRCLISIKSGSVKPGDVRDLRGTMTREQAPLGLLVSLRAPSREMKAEALAAGFYEPEGLDAITGAPSIPVIQIITIEELLTGKQPLWPPLLQASGGTFKHGRRR